MRFSSSVITMERRSATIMILSLARSNSSIPTMRLLARAANRAASFTRFAKSAPENPGVPGDVAWLHVVVERNAAHVHPQNLLTATHVRQRHHDLAVEAARAQQ